MREITFNVYHFDELSAEAKKTAVENMRVTIGSMLCDSDADEYCGALKEIEKIFEIKVYDWCVDYPSTNFRWRFNENSRFSDLSDNPRFLVRYLDEVERWCRKGKYYFGRHTKRHSKVMFERNYCLTGSWTSAVVDDYMEKRWDYVRHHRTIEDFVDDMLYAFFKQWERDQENNYEDEQIEETILANEYEFMEDGKPY